MIDQITRFLHLGREILVQGDEHLPVHDRGVDVAHHKTVTGFERLSVHQQQGVAFCGIVQRLSVEVRPFNLDLNLAGLLRLGVDRIVIIVHIGAIVAVTFEDRVPNGQLSAA